MVEFKKFEDGSTGLSWPPPAAPQLVVTLMHGLTLPRNSRTSATFARGETISLDLDEATSLMGDGWAIKPGDPEPDLTPQLVSVVQPFVFRGKAYRVGLVVSLPKFFVDRARARELVGDPPVPEKKPELSETTKAAIETRVVARRREAAKKFVEELIA